MSDPRSPDNTEFGHFTSLFYRGRQRNVPRIIMHGHSHCFANYLFGDCRQNMQYTPAPALSGPAPALSRFSPLESRSELGTH